jgi:mRNA interferase RelE/StbE
MIYYEKKISKKIKKGDLPQNIIKRFHNAFLSVDLTRDLDLFDIKRLKGSYSREYYRLRKRKYSAIFYFEGKNIFVVNIGKREEVYDSWELHQLD